MAAEALSPSGAGKNKQEKRVNCSSYKKQFFLSACVSGSGGSSMAIASEIPKKMLASTHFVEYSLMSSALLATCKVSENLYA